MPEFGKKSKSRLATCDWKLQQLFNEVIKHYDCTIICGLRGEAEQEGAFRLKKSTKRYPDSKHNVFPSVAVDAAPWPLDWDDIERFRHFAGFVEGVALGMGIKIRSGGDWDSDRDFEDQKLIDLPHFELVEEE